MKKGTILGVVALMLVALSTSCAEEQPAAKTAGRAAAKSYNLMTVKRGEAEVVSRFSAAIRGAQNVEIRPQITGVITDILIDEGAQIRKGQKLFIIDQVPYQAAVDVAKANLEIAEKSVEIDMVNLEAAKELLAEGIISETEYVIAQKTVDAAQATLSQAKAQSRSANNDLSYTVITSPVDGVAGMISYRVGSLVNSSISDPLVSVTNNDQMHAYFSMSEPQLLTMIENFGSTQKMIEYMADVELLMNNGSLYNVKGDVDAISGTVDRTTGTVAMRATFANPNKILRDGGSGRILVTTHRENVIVIPKVATFELQNKIFAYKVVDGKATSEQIAVFPINDGNNYIVESGLVVGDVIIAEGAGLVREGEQIMVDDSKK